jgi:hypothetical protein
MEFAQQSTFINTPSWSAHSQSCPRTTSASGNNPLAVTLFAVFRGATRQLKINAKKNLSYLQVIGA